LRQLLGDPDDFLVAATATGMWECITTPKIAPDLMDPWRHAVIRGNIREYDLCEMFKMDNALAYSWLLDRSLHRPNGYQIEHDAITTAARLLTREQRASILEHVSPRVYDARGIVSALVDSDEELYRGLLKDSDREDVHLAPLCGTPNTAWAQLAVVALESGISPREVADIAFHTTFSGWGSIADRCEEQVKSWVVLENHADPRIREVASIGRKMAEESASRWRKEDDSEEFFEIYGR
jgi:hypothetical protein